MPQCTGNAVRHQDYTIRKTSEEIIYGNVIGAV